MHVGMLVDAAYSTCSVSFVPRPAVVPYVVDGLEMNEDMFLGGCLILGGGIEKINVISQTP